MSARRGWLWWALPIVWGAVAFETWAAPAERTVRVLSPHNEAIRLEFGRAFALWHQREYGAPATVEWRDIGGSTDALRFLESEFKKKPEGIGLDCLFGGGLEPYLRLAAQQWLAPFTPPDDLLNGIPRQHAGVELYDRDHRWFGTALSSFGILQSLDIQQRLGLPRARRWEQLARPELVGWVGAGDPRNSGTMSVMYETFLQAYGWEQGWQLLTQMGGNVRQFDRFSSTTAKNVALGETAYALAIDFYAFTQIAAAGPSHLTFTVPTDFAALVPDGIAVLKGAPQPALAQRFVTFVLSEAGQKLWFLPRGHPEGPQFHSIERMVVRPDLYPRYRGVSNIEFSPFDLQTSTRYDGALARERADVVAALVGALLVDTHPELRRAWRAILRRGAAPEELRRLGQMPMSADEALQLARGPWRDAVQRTQWKIGWQRWARQKYRALE